MKKLLHLFLLSLIVFTSCNEEDEIIDIAIQNKHDNQKSVTICHLDEISGTLHTITVNKNALEKHIAHGDRIGGGCEDYTYVPDNNFEQALIDFGYDIELDDYVLTNNIKTVTTLEIFNKGITDLTGIEGFAELVTLKASDGKFHWLFDETTNQISTIDLTHNIHLEWLDLGKNKLKSIDLSKNPNLVFLELWLNELTTLDVSHNPKLEILSAGYNQLSTIDVSNNPNLINFQVFNNQITNLDVTKNINLEILYVHEIPFRSTNYYYDSDNQLTSIDVSHNSKLRILWVRDNNLTFLDVSRNSSLYQLKCDNNQLASLVIGIKNSYLSLSTLNNPSLTCIQIDDAVVDNYSQSWRIDSWTSFSKDCGY